jgi:hypothetical protein
MMLPYPIRRAIKQCWPVLPWTVFEVVMERPLVADCVEKVDELAERPGAKRQARVVSLVLRRAATWAVGSALPVFGGSGPWQRGGTRPERQTDLSV